MSNSHTRHRSAGILLHPVSLPGAFGIGDLGPVAAHWLRWLANARMKWWQVLPLGPTGFADSPYQSFSSFAGNTNMLSPERLVEDQLLLAQDLERLHLPTGAIAYETVIQAKSEMIKTVWQRFSKQASAALRSDFEAFCQHEAAWLDDFALFMALKHDHQQRPWSDWPEELATRVPPAIRHAVEKLRAAIEREKLAQFLFFRQWQAVRDEARGLGIALIGDMPIFVAYDSADVWAHPEYFELDNRRRPTVVAGVPPDYFAATGQLWGNPLFRWDALRESGYAWWIDRLRATLRMVDVVRLDHFRGFQAYWEVPAEATTAMHGRWVEGPGDNLLDTLRKGLGGLPLIAEDLGFITADVDRLRERHCLPGMRILQFAFGGAVESRFLPHNLTRDVVVYTGTHDNDTTLGWHASLSIEERNRFARYVPGSDVDPAWSLIRLAWASVADCAVAPMQDVLRLGSEARMNRPGSCVNNWRWRMTDAQMSFDLSSQIAELTEIYDRAG